jgi:large conductance mechanosensitive channel
MKMWKEFKKFIQRGSVIDLAVGVIIGGAFGSIVNSLVNDVIMPPVGLLVGNVDFSDLYINLSGGDYQSLAEAQSAGAVTINIGLFINAIINFLILAFVIFILVHQVNKLQKPETEATPTTKECPFCYSNIPIKATRCPQCTSALK